MLKRQIIVVFSLVFVLLLLQQPVIRTAVAQPTTYQNTGTPRPVIEYSEGTFSDTAIGPLPDNTTITIPAEWSSIKVYTRVYNLLHKKDWIINGTFENGNSATREPPAPWQYYEKLDDENRTTGEIQSYWNISSPLGSGGAIIFNITNGSLINQGEYAMWNETVCVDEGTVASATIRVYYYAIDLTQSPTNDAVKLFLTLWIFAGTNVYTYTLKFRDAIVGSVQSIEVPIDPTIFSTPQNITIGIGISGNGGTIDSDNDIICYDNVTLLLECLAKPSQVNLNFADAYNLSNSVIVSDLGFGDGEAILETSVSWTGDVNFTFLSSPLVDGTVTLCANTTVYITHAIQTDSSEFFAPSEGDVEWTLTFLAKQLPAPYVTYYFNVSYPLDWNVTSVLDSYGYEQFNTSDPNAFEYITPSGKVLKCDVSDTGHYGVWTIYLISNNYVRAFKVQYWDIDENAWKDAGSLPSFYVNESTKVRICVRITDKNGNVPADNGVLNITVYFPNGSKWFSNITSSLDPQGWGNTSGFVLSANNASAGRYSVSISWSNGEEAGYIASGLFIVIHRTSLTSDKMEYFVYRGDFITVRVRFLDIDVNTSVVDAVVVYSWVGGSGKMLYSGGWYIIDIDSSKAPDIGIYNVTIAARKFGYENHSIVVKVEVQDRSELISPVERLTVYVGRSFTLNVCYNDTFTGEGIVNATVIYVWEFGSGQLTEIGDGYYQLNLTPPASGAYKITFYASKVGYADAYTDVIVLVTVLPTDLAVEKYEIIVPIGDVAVVRVYYNNTKDGIGITNASVVYSWKYGVGHMEDLGNGTYIITIPTVNLPFDTYAIIVTAFKSGYETQTATVRLTVIRIPTELIAENLVISVIQKSKFTIRVYYNDTWHNMLVSGANVTYSWEFGNGTLLDLGNGTYIITLRAPLAREEPYDIVIVAQKDLYETSTITISIVSKPSAVMLSLKALALGSGSAVAVMGGIASWYFYFRFPPFVRLIRSISKRLERGKPLKLGKVRNRKEIISNFIREDYRILLEKIPAPSKEGLEVEVLEGEVEEELVEAGEETLKETVEIVEKLTGVQLPEELKEKIEKEEKEE
ncbi:MAG: hypothetical protein ACTSV7_09365 [Candidatus Baldrarchaeia archaeon]